MKNTHAGGKVPSYPELATATLTGPEDTGIVAEIDSVLRNREAGMPEAAEAPRLH